MLIRPIQMQDATAYKQILEQLDQETPYLAWELVEQSLSIEDLEHQISTQDVNTKVILLAEDKGTIWGLLAGVRGHTHRLHHRADFTMGVLKSAWGKGIGTQLFIAFEQWALNHDIWRLELTVTEHNQRAIALYEKFGFLQEGRKIDAFVVNHKKEDEIVMGKLLAPPSKASSLEHQDSLGIRQTPMTLMDIAALCHNLRKALCEAYGDHSQVDWEHAEAWQRQSTLEGVEFALSHPEAPAGVHHEAWMRSKLKNGWQYGPIKDVEKKKHPCLVPYDQLPSEEKAKDYLFKEVVRGLSRFLK